MRKWSAQEILVAIACLACVAPVVLIFLTAFKPEARRSCISLGLLPHRWTRENFHEILRPAEEIRIFPLALEFGIYLDERDAAEFCWPWIRWRRMAWRAYQFARAEMDLFVDRRDDDGAGEQILLVPVYLILNRLHWLDTPAALDRARWRRRVRRVSAASNFSKASGKNWKKPADDRRMFAGLAHTGTSCCHWRSRRWRRWRFLRSSDRGTIFSARWCFWTRSRNTRCQWALRCSRSSYFDEYGLTLSASVICTLPIIVIFLLFHRHVIHGIAATGLKE